MNKVLIKTRVLVLVIFTCIGLIGCSQPEGSEKQQSTPMVQVFTVSDNDQTVVRHFVARVDALSTVDMAFQVAGRINKLVERQGVVIPQGDTLAALEPQDYNLALKQAEASFRKAKSDYERGKQLQNDNYISQSDFDALKTAYENAELAVENAKINIDYTVLHAPFDALITNRLVEKFSYVQPNQSVLRVQNINFLRVHVNVPEQLMRYASERNPAYNVFLENEDGELLTNSDGNPVALTYLENKTEINTATQTYQVTFKLPRDEGLDLLPGMVLTARVVIANPTMGTGLWVPMTAIDSTGGSEFAVWIIDNGKVSYQPVDVGLIRDGKAQITRGVSPGDKLVAAGVAALQEGMAVREFTKESQVL